MGETLGPIILFYGIRAYLKDFLYKDELISLFKTFGEQAKLHICESVPEDITPEEGLPFIV